jgi:DNA-binding transcriptional MerR regulator
MLRYIDRAGLVAPVRSGTGYRVYRPAELGRLVRLKELLAAFDLELSNVVFAARMETDIELRRAVETWLGVDTDSDAEPKPADSDCGERHTDVLLATLQ